MYKAVQAGWVSFNPRRGGFRVESDRSELWWHSVPLAFRGHARRERTVRGLPAGKGVCVRAPFTLLGSTGSPPTQVKRMCRFVQVLFYSVETSTREKCVLVAQSRRWHVLCLLPLASCSKCGAGIRHGVNLSREGCEQAEKLWFYHLRNVLPVSFLCFEIWGLERRGVACAWLRPTTDVAGLLSCRNSKAIVSGRLITLFCERKGLVWCEVSLNGTYLCVFTLQPLNCAPTTALDTPISKAIY